MIIGTKFSGYSRDGVRRLYMGGGGGGQTQTTSTSYNTNVPEYARPYVETMLGATQKQLFEGTPTEGGGFDITGFKPYQPYSTNPSDYVAGFSPMQQQSQQQAAGMQTSPQTAAASDMTQQAGIQALNTQYQGGQFQNQFQAPGQYNPAQAAMYTAQAPNLQQYQMGPAQQVRTQSFAAPGSAEAYMSPYMQSVVDIQQREAQRQSDIAGTQLAGQATKSGAFGGSRQGIMQAEAARNLAQQKGDIQATGSQAAYQQAQQQFNAEQAARLQAQQANQGAGLQVGGQNLAAQLGIQQLGAGQSLQAQLANQRAFQDAQQLAEQSRQYGAGYGMTAAQNAAQYGQSAQQLAEQSRQYGAGLGLQGLQTALQGAGQLGALGSQQFAQGMDINKLQAAYGAQQQSMEQQKINQAIQDYANAQQYPLMQLGVMSNMLRGLPMQAATTNQYVAAPNQLTQGIGLAGTGASLYSAFNPPAGRAPGMAKGGIASVPRYDVGGEVESDLESMPTDALVKQAKESPSPIIRQKAQRILRERQMEQSAAPQGIQYQAPQGMAGGGIIAFKEPTEENNQSLVTDADAINERYRQGQMQKLKNLFNFTDGPRRGYQSGFTPEQKQTTAAPAAVSAPAAAAAAAPVLAPAAVPAPAKSIKAVPVAASPAASVEPNFTGIYSVDRAGEDDARKVLEAQLAAASAAAAPAAAAPAVDDKGSAVNLARTAYEDQRAIGDKPLDNFIAEQEAARKKLGLDQNVGRDEQRRDVMAELANADDESRRQKFMMAAKFFASWGSKSGPTLVAGMQAVQESVPEFIAEEKDRKKVNRELKKIVYTLDEATRQEKLGYFKEAVELKQKAGAAATEMYKTYLNSLTSADASASAERRDVARDRALDVRTEKGDAAATAREKYRVDESSRIRTLEIKSAEADRAQRTASGNQSYLISRYNAMVESERRTLADIERERSGKDYQALLQKANSPDTVTGPLKEQRDKAIEALRIIDERNETRRKTAARRTDALERAALGTDSTDTGMSPTEKKAAETWLKANPNDPRAAEIKKKLGL